MDWQSNIIKDEAGMSGVLEQTRTIAVLGIKTEAQAGQPAFYVPHILKMPASRSSPSLVYYPDVTEILGHRVYRKLTDIPDDVDLVNVFRRSEDVPQHLDDILAKKPKAVWMHSASATMSRQKLAQAGIKVVQNRCLMVDHRNSGRPEQGRG